jgi:hypothetical protein
MIKVRYAYKIVVGKHEGKGVLRRHRSRWKDDIKIKLKGIVCEGVDWIHLAQDWDQWVADVNTVKNLNIT